MGKLIETLRKLQRQTISVDPSKFDDPIAMKTEWIPLRSGGSNFRTHRLVEKGYHRFEFKSTIFALVFYLIFFLVGSGLLGFALYSEFLNSFQLEESSLILSAIGIVFFLVGLGLIISGTKPIVFDKMSGYFWKGRTSPNQNIEYSKPELFTHLNEIHALQIIQERVSSDKSSYYSYELNLVLRDGQRKNVIDHGNLDRLQEDAQKISEFLNKPLWDVTN